MLFVILIQQSLCIHLLCWLVLLCTWFAVSSLCSTSLTSWWLPVPSLGPRLAVFHSASCAGRVCLHVRALPPHSLHLFWLAFTRTHCRHSQHKRVSVTVSVCRRLSSCAEWMCVAFSLLTCSLHKVKLYLCLFSLPKSFFFNCKLNQY